MQAWAFPRTLKPVHHQTDIMKDTNLSQALNKRLADDPVFFVYDHNMLKKEEDDLKDAILYFAPEFMSGDDQCALCGQLMGMVEFLGASISQSPPVLFKFDQEKFALKQLGSYSFGLQASVSVPDSVMSEQLMSLYEVFVTFHGSVDSVRLRFKESHSQFLKEFGAIWRVILQVSGVSLHSSLSQTFNHVPCIHLPKSGSHLFSQASHVLQSSQRRPFVLAGAIFYKNKVLCTQLSPTLTRHLTFLQNQIPYIARTTESDMPKGCKIITIFLTDDELNQISPHYCNTSRHCKSTNFNLPVKKQTTNTAPKYGRKLIRRQTCSSVPVFSPEASKSPALHPEQPFKRYVSNEQLKSFYGRQEAMRVEQSTWGRNKSKLHLSHVPLVECQAGESPSPGDSPSNEDRDKIAQYSTHVGQTYQQLELKQHYDSLALDELSQPSDGSVIHTSGGTKDSKSGGNRSDASHKKGDIAKLEREDKPVAIQESKCVGLDYNTKNAEINCSKGIGDLVAQCNAESSYQTKDTSDESIRNVEMHENTNTNVTNRNTKICVKRSESNDATFQIDTGNSFIKADEPIAGKHNIMKLNVSNEINASIESDVHHLVSESDVSETEDEMEVVADSFMPCIECLDLNEGNQTTSKGKCEKCDAQPSRKEVIGRSGVRQEILDFGRKTDHVNESDGDEIETQSDIEGRHFYSAKSEALLNQSALSSFSSDVSTDSTISRYWTNEMEGLNDVTLYVQCHSEISLLLILENPEQYEENLFHSLWKGSLSHLADLDYYITECLENEEIGDGGFIYKYARFDAFSSELHTNVEDVTMKRREVHLPQMLGVIHSDFKDRHGLTDVTLRSPLSCCYGHQSQGDETYFLPELTNQPFSGLPVSKDPASNVDVVARQRLSEDKKLTFL